MNNINLPGFIDNTNFKFLNIDEKIIISIIIQDYPKYTEFIQIMESIPKNINYDISMYIKKQDISKVLKDLTYKISSSSAEIKTINKNQIDIDIINNLKKDAINLRKEIQINNQDIFNINIIITFYSSDYKELMYNIKLFQSTLYSKNLISNLTNFRHLNSYILSLPLSRNKSNFLSLNERSFTTDSLSLNFPFYIKNIFDRKGIIFGFTGNENKICNIDLFNSKYLNSNMCILGSSGSGKSYFTKLLIIRHFLIGKRQYVFDYEEEYMSLAKNLNHIYINFSDNDEYIFNVFEIQEYELQEFNWFEKKVQKILKLIIKIIKIDSDKEIEVVKEAIKKTYNDFHINEDINSVYKNSSNDKVYIDNKIKNPSYFPSFLDLLNNIKSKKICNHIKEKIIKRYKCISSHSNFNISDKLVIFGTKNIINIEEIELVKYFLNEIKQIAMNDNKKTIIYMDEIWKYLSVKEDSDMALMIFEYFKTLRKYNCSIVSITQDIGDFFSYKNGSYGKSILNNCGFKMFFRLEYSDKKILENINLIQADEINIISRLEKGQVLMNFCNNKVILNIKSSDYEKKLMEVENENNFSFK